MKPSIDNVHRTTQITLSFQQKNSNNIAMLTWRQRIELVSFSESMTSPYSTCRSSSTVISVVLISWVVSMGRREFAALCLIHGAPAAGDVRQSAADLVFLDPFLLLHPSVLEPNLDLCLVESECWGDLDTASAGEVLVEMELLLEFSELFVGEVSSSEIRLMQLLLLLLLLLKVVVMMMMRRRRKTTTCQVMRVKYSMIIRVRYRAGHVGVIIGRSTCNRKLKRYDYKGEFRRTILKSEKKKVWFDKLSFMAPL